VFGVSMALRLLAALAFHRLVREVRAVRPVGLREAVLDLVGQRLVALLGMLSVEPEIERGDRPSDPRRLRSAPPGHADRQAASRAGVRPREGRGSL
jgi:hypothetical protein